jgi:hypothetical protein
MSHSHASHTPEVHAHSDEWHHHTPDEGVPQAEHAANLNTVVLLKWFALIIIFIVVSIGALWQYFNYYTAHFVGARTETEVLAQDYYTKKASIDAELANFGVVDAKAGTVQIPVGDAMKKVVEKYGKK